MIRDAKRGALKKQGGVPTPYPLDPQANEPRHYQPGITSRRPVPHPFVGSNSFPSMSVPDHRPPPSPMAVSIGSSSFPLLSASIHRPPPSARAVFVGTGFEIYYWGSRVNSCRLRGPEG